jgi:hypothetical protein
MQYSPLFDTLSARGSISSIDQIDNNIQSMVVDRNDYHCRSCKIKLIKKQETNHTSTECLSERCELLEDEVLRLKDHDLKSRLRIKELDNKIIALETAIKGLALPKQEQAAPYSFGIGRKPHHALKKTQSVDLPQPISDKVNYDHILRPKRSHSRERVGLFGSLGAASQQR